MSEESDAGGTGGVVRDRRRTLVGLLAVCSLVLAAAVLPAFAGQSPGDGLGQGANLSGEASAGTPLVGGLLGRLPQGSGGGLFGSLAGPQGGAGSPGALRVGQSTGVGSGALSAALRNQSTTPHFLVESDAAAYWRTGAFDTYTGQGWAQGGEARPVRWPRAADGTDATRVPVTQQYRLLRGASALPAAYQVTDVSRRLRESVTLTPSGALRADSVVATNSTYTVTSSVPDPSPAALREAGTDYPAAVRDRYTALPESLPDRVSRFTENLTANATTPYATAAAIERWLEANKDYSLNASHGSGDVTAQFLFEMDRGYCEYFASAMTVMLRSQGIPARYTVGYSTGQSVGGDQYLVRGMNAHAWVEVYFPEVGWVQFDPTPGRERLGSEREAFEQALESGSLDDLSRQFLDSATGGSPVQGSNDPSPYDHTEAGSPDEQFGTAENASALLVAVNGGVTPGANVTVRVSRSGEAVPGAVVAFNGDRVGVTDDRGRVTARVPYERELTITARAPGDGQNESGGTAVGGSLAGRPTTTQDNETNATRTYRLSTAVDLELAGATRPGNEVVLTATVDGVAVPDARVTLDGDPVGRTGGAGNYTLSLPVAERVTVAVSRGEAAGNRTLELADVNVTTEGLAVAGLPVTVRVTDQGDPVANATVSVGGRQVTTGPDGRAEVSLPLANGATLTGETPVGITATAALDWLFLPILTLVGGLVAVVGGTYVLRRRARAAGRSLAAHLAAIVSRLANRVTAAGGHVSTNRPRRAERSRPGRQFF